MSGRAGTLPGGLVISLDFELRWGVRESCPPGSAYERNVLGAREVIPRLLEVFASYQVRATWATVGLLFARSREERQTFIPAELPAYRNTNLSPYADPVGHDESDDPLHYAPSLIQKVASTPGQEIGTHTFGHYYCQAPGQTAEEFRADLDSAVAIARTWGVDIRSIVFPRNQHNPAYDGILIEKGVRSYRGNPNLWMWRSASPEHARSPVKRAARLADTYLPMGDVTVAWEDLVQPNGLTNVAASVFLRPFRARARALEEIRFRRITAALRAAAERHRLLHLWWHPHNFGLHSDDNVAFLRRILDEFRRLRDSRGMVSLSMLDADSMVRERIGPAVTAAASR